MNPMTKEERAGCIQLRKARETGTIVGVYQANEAGIEIDPTDPWATVCEDHSSVVMHRTRKLALYFASTPSMWCEDCQAELARKAAVAKSKK